MVPPYYQGTSFEDIVINLKTAAEYLGTAIHFIGSNSALANKLTGEVLDDQQYVVGQNLLLQELISYPRLSRLLFIDFFNPGLDLIRYLHQQQNIRCRYGSLLHGGTFLSDDLYSWPWLQQFERAWTAVYDIIYAPSKFLVEASPEWISQKTKVFHWGMDTYNQMADTRLDLKGRNIDVVFPHRVASDKGITDLIAIVSEMADTRFAITTSQEKSIMMHNPYFYQLSKYKNVQFIYAQSTIEHLKTLQRSHLVLSCAKQENFGYAMMKAIIAGCIPIAPQQLCYPEFIPQEFLYKNLKEAEGLIRQHLTTRQSSVSRRILEPVAKDIRGFSFLPLLQDFFNE